MLTPLLNSRWQIRDQIEFENEVEEMSGQASLVKISIVYSLISGRNRIKTDDASSNMLTHIVIIHLNMFGAVMKNIIMDNLDSSAIITRQGNGGRRSYTHIIKQSLKSQNFVSSINECTIFSLDARPCSDDLVFTMPRDKRIT